MLNTEGLIEYPTPAPYPFGPPDVASILNAGLAEHPDRLALIDGDRTWTWAQLEVAVSEMASGIAPGELMWWSLGNCAEMVIGALATFRAGAVWVGLSDRRPRSTLPWLIDRLGPVTLIDSVKDYARLAGTSLHRTQEVPVDPMAPAVVTFTSGTSGVAKAVVHSQRNLLWPGLISAELEPSMPGERIGTPLSLSIANMLALGPLSAFLRDSTFVVMSRTFADGFAADVHRFGVTRCFVVPTVLHDQIHDEFAAPAQLASLDRIIVGGSGAEPELLRTFETMFGIRPTLSYGLSEAPTGVVRESLDDPIGSGRGFPLPHIEVQIVDSAGIAVDIGVEGEICLLPAAEGTWANTWTPTLGYVGQPEQTAELFHDGRLHTGDTGRVDSDGALSVTGRLSNVIIRGGKNIDPITIENALAAHPWVTEAVVVGLPDERLGQIVAALVVPSGESFNGDAIIADVSRKLGSSGLIDRWASALGLPRNEMGKVIRNLPPEAFLTNDDPVITYLRNDGGTLEG